MTFKSIRIVVSHDPKIRTHNRTKLVPQEPNPTYVRPCLVNPSHIGSSLALRILALVLVVTLVPVRQDKATSNTPDD